MKKILVFAFLMAACAVVGSAQESRQDISISGTGWLEPFTAGPVVRVHSNVAEGALVSYRFMLTPSSALEANYGITYQNKIHFTGSALGSAGVTVNTRTQELSAAYVRSFNFKRWNPFIEAGPGVVIFLPIINSGTTTHDVKQQTTIAGFYGAGIAYELSPSFDLRAEYRGVISKVPSFNATPENLTTNKYWNIYVPTIGVAYHF